MNTKLRIIMFVNTTVFGGVEKHVADIVNGINKEQFDIFIVCAKENYIYFKEELKGREGHIIPISQGSFLNISSIVQFVGVLRRIKPHIVHCHLYNATRFAAPIAKVFGIPVVETGHLVEKWRKGFKKVLASKIDKIVSVFVDRLIGVSLPVAQYYIEEKKYWETKVSVIHNWCDRSHFNPDRFNSNTRRTKKKAEKIDDDLLVVGLVGRLDEQKGHTYLIEALPKIIAQYPNIIVVFVGDGSLKDALVAQARSNDTYKFIRFLGFRKDLPELLSIMDVLVLPSLFEGMPLTLIEAAAMGVPVVATSVDGSKDVVLEGKTGFLVENPADTNKISQRVNDLLADQQLRQDMGIASIQRANECFDMHCQIKLIEQEYVSILNKKQKK